MEETLSNSVVNAVIGRARTCSPFLRLQVESFGSVVERLTQGDVAGALSLARAEREAGEIATGLRRERRATALITAIGDLAGLMSFRDVVGLLSDLADRALDQAIASVIEARTPGAPVAGFAAIALGKHGSRELNYSSDIDLILLYDPARLPLRPREEAQQGAVRIAQAVSELLSKRTGDGYVFRVDLRLRPSPEVTPVALPVDAAISYYESQALPWERAAFIRARAVAGDMALGRQFLDSIHPFVWRRSLDFGAIGEVQSITHRIRDHYSQGQGFGPGFDLKRGRGGIREVEFFAQIHQLIHGGRDPGLRAPATLDALAALADAGHLAAAEAAGLAGAYETLRTIEHRLQMVDDRQTHELPAAADRLDNVARLHGVADGPALLDLLRPHVGRIASAYDRLGSGADSQRLPLAAEALEQRLAEAGFPEPAPVRLRIEAWRSGKPRSLRTQAAVNSFEAMLPDLIDAFGRSPDPMRAVHRFDDLVSRLPSGVNFFRLLMARPGLAEIVASMLAHAPALADQLATRPQLLDGLIDATAFEPAPSVPQLIDQFERAERQGEDYQLLLDRVRWLVGERKFALGAQVIARRSDPLDAGAGYARVAEAAIDVVTRATIAAFEAAHGRVAGSDLVILGLGRLGGEALTNASDLDLVYLFTGTHEARSDGAKPLGATDYFNRLAQRVTAALSVPTPSGRLYEVDTRLRPHGREGLFAVSVQSFADYQRTSAWTWEHMALTRARPVFGSSTDRAEAERVIRSVLERERSMAAVAAEAARMRSEMAKHKPPAGPLDIKLGPGGLVDLEFAVQAVQLGHRIGLHPQLDRSIDALVDAGLLRPSIADAHHLLTRMLVTLRLVCPTSDVPPEPSRALVAGACGHDGWDSLLAAHDEARQSIADAWAAVRAVGGESE